ncbi:MAG: ABC transporter ATP-binding protein [SAR202 cluster bacterium]|mgnify:FL=1|nr:ABC transporter ATP-binding protein [SAR202 cluster bacterium]|tara:strand:- start:15610 stop:16593 length:984 start_codon:yes stop_codon:yes gene_type:complete
MSKLLEINNLSTNFFTPRGILKAVNNISYNVNSGEIVGIVGESGSGKSVSALSIMGLVPNPPGKIISGEIIFNGQNILKFSNSKMRKLRSKEISMIFQEPMTCLNPVLTIQRQLTETLELHLKLTPKQSFSRSKELLSMVGIPDAERILKNFPHTLSGGMRQRIMIAIAISCNPKLIIADEPTTALDVTIQAQILDLLKTITSDIGSAMIIITHNLGIVAKYADRVLVMYGGKIIENSPAEEIYYSPKHPYTLGLLRAVPRLDAPIKNQLETIEGTTPDLTESIIGCNFSSRCEFSTNKCEKEDPPFSIVGKEHYSACWESNKIPKP